MKVLLGCVLSVIEPRGLYHLVLIYRHLRRYLWTVNYAGGAGPLLLRDINLDYLMPFSIVDYSIRE